MTVLRWDRDPGRYANGYLGMSGKIQVAHVWWDALQSSSDQQRWALSVMDRRSLSRFTTAEDAQAQGQRLWERWLRLAELGGSLVPPPVPTL